MSFHRGIWPDKHTSLKSAIGYVIMCALAKILIRNVEIRDVSYDLDKIAFYDDCDFHLGYRVHAHLYFLSKRLPSILINEDGRGEGMVTSLGMDVLNLHDPALLSKVESLLIKYRDGDLSDFEAVVAKLDESFSEMRSFLEGLNLETNVESNIS